MLAGRAAKRTGRAPRLPLMRPWPRPRSSRTSTQHVLTQDATLRVVNLITAPLIRRCRKKLTLPELSRMSTLIATARHCAQPASAMRELISSKSPHMRRLKRISFVLSTFNSCRYLTSAAPAAAYRRAAHGR